MTREEMIEILIHDRIHDWVFAKNYDGLEEILYVGWEGFEKYSDEEMEDAFEDLIEDNFGEDIAEKIRLGKKQIKLRRVKKLKYAIDDLVEDLQKK